jgi:hypothetical protein
MTLFALVLCASRVCELINDSAVISIRRSLSFKNFCALFLSYSRQLLYIYNLRYLIILTQFDKRDVRRLASRIEEVQPQGQ